MDEHRQLFAGDGGENDLFLIVVVHALAVEVGAAAIQLVENALPDFLIFFGDNQHRLIAVEARNNLVHHHAGHVNHQPGIQRHGPVFEGNQSDEHDGGVNEDEDSA